MGRDRLGRSAIRVVGSAGVAGLILVAFVSRDAQSHKAVTSKYTYNEDVYPILRDRCGRCHVSGGAAPMSLLSYKEALPWAESIHEEVTHERMPPWYADNATAINGYSLTARELDTLMVWATGGAPEGNPEHRPEPATARNEWLLGAPDLLIPIAAYTMPDDTQDSIRDFTVPAALGETRWLRAVDLRPGTPALVRSAIITVDSPAASETVLNLWQPGETLSPVPEGTAFKLPADSQLRVQIRYKRPWDAHGVMSDRSAVGLYFTGPPSPGQEVQTLPLSAAPANDPDMRRFACEVRGNIRVLAVIPTLDQPYAAFDVRALLPDGSILPLLHLAHPRPEWDRRYWLAHPIDLPEGARLEAAATMEPPNSDAPSRAVPLGRALQIAANFVAR